MKKIIFPIVSLSLILLLLITGCKDDSISAPEGNNFYSKELTTYDFEDAMNEIEDASLENGMGFNSFFQRPDFPRNGFFDRGQPGDRKHKRHLRLKRIFEALQLSEEQKAEVEVSLGEYRECLAPAIEQFRTAALEYIESANIEREAIITRVHNGEITREDGGELLRNLNMATKELIKNDPDCQTARESMCDCKTSLFDTISSSLTEDQLAVWNDWIENHSRPCQYII